MRRPMCDMATALFVALLVTTVGCSGRRTPSREEAAQLLGQIPQFTAASITRTFGLYRGRCITPGLDEAENRQYAAIAGIVERGGAIKVERRKATEKDCGFLAFGGADVVAITLTPEGQRVSSEWPRRPVNDMNSQLAIDVGGQRGPDWNVPFERRRFGEVTGVADPDPATAQVPVEFRWERLGVYDGSISQNRGTAMFRHYDTGWRIEGINGLGDK